jgi:heme exporter protein C
VNRGNILGYVAATLLAAAGWAIFMVAPDEMTMGAIQRIFYLHLGCAATAFLAFLVVLCSSPTSPTW